MTKGGFFETTFQPVSLSLADSKELQDVVKTIVDASFGRYVNFSGVDPNLWKPLKTKDGIQVYSSRSEQHRRPQPPYSEPVDDDSELQSLLCIGWTSTSLDDLMQGVVDSTTAVSTSRTSFGNDFSDTAMLALVKDPSVLEPYTSVAVKWMELDVRRRSMGLVKNRDYVYVEMTGARSCRMENKSATTLCTRWGSHKLTLYRAKSEPSFLYARSSVKWTRPQCPSTPWG